MKGFNSSLQISVKVQKKKPRLENEFGLTKMSGMAKNVIWVKLHIWMCKVNWCFFSIKRMCDQKKVILEELMLMSTSGITIVLNLKKTGRNRSCVSPVRHTGVTLSVRATRPDTYLIYISKNHTEFTINFDWSSFSNSYNKDKSIFVITIYVNLLVPLLI